MVRQISIIDMLKHSGKFNLVNLMNNIFSIPKSIIIAVVLSPSDYGVISYLGLWSLYAALVNPGFISASNREIAYLIGRKEGKRPSRYKIFPLRQTWFILYCRL